MVVYRLRNVCQELVWSVAVCAALLAPSGCSSGTADSVGADEPDASVPSGRPPAVDPTCTTVRVTHYRGGPSGWCEFSKKLPVLPKSVRDGMTLAIAEPWNGGSYGGDSGESCGECWEVSSSWGTRVLMVTDLCPIKGNPLCAGGHFHFDLATEAADALETKGLDAASARRVPCPVSGNIHAVVNDWNKWGYMRVAFVNMRVPLRAAWVRAAPKGDWHAFSRSGGAWQIKDAPKPDEASGLVFRVQSAQGQMVEATSSVPFQVGASSDAPAVVDIGVQFDDQNSDQGTCAYHPPGNVYKDGYGGIDELRWKPNPWGDVKVSEAHSGCHDGSKSCLQVDNLRGWDGMHIYYYPTFPRDSFSTLELWGRAADGPVTVELGPGGKAGDKSADCAFQEATFGNTWTKVQVDIPSACGNVDVISSVTIHSQKQGGTVFLDDIKFL